MKNRIKTIFSNLETTLDAILLKNGTQPFIDPSFFYVTGLQQGLFEGSYAFLQADGSLDLLVPELEVESAKKAQATLHVYKTKDEAEQFIKQITSSFQSIGIHFAGLTHKDYHAIHELCPKVTFQDVSSSITETRLVKDTDEIRCIKEACRITDMVMNSIPSLLHQGLKEYELAAEIDYTMEKHGAEKPAFTTISSFGKNTAEPHYSHGESALKTGDFVLCDFGACYHNYNADLTRTFIYGKATPRQKEMYATVLEAQTIGLEQIKPGVTAGDVHHAVAECIDKTPWKGLFIHSTGHSLGLMVHDGPGFSPDSPLVLKENMVLTVEPGVYLPGFGGVRIEDDIVVKKDGMELLTHSSKVFTEVL